MSNPTELEIRQKKARTRSPSYPYLNLQAAIDKAAVLWKAEGRHAVAVNIAMQHWGYKTESSTGYSCIAALKKFALVEEDGMGDSRQIKLSALALSILLDEDPRSQERVNALQRAALSPRIHAELWERYGLELPSDSTLKRFLIIEKNFNEASVDEFLEEYKTSIAYADLRHKSAASTLAHKEEEYSSEFLPLLSPLQERGNYTQDSLLLSASHANVPTRAIPLASLSHTVLEGGENSLLNKPTLSRASSQANEPHMGRSENPSHKELPVPLENGSVAWVPYPMSEEDFSLLMDTLMLWKKRLVKN